ncbi:MAG: HAMP domain-containing sensor histidine kinase [Desulfobacteraceae bacterium]|nr:HAMP domain-containing sensor histidine kinase [Desulfobacteraceae bacterium]
MPSSPWLRKTLIGLLIGIVTLLHYLTSSRLSLYHVIYRQLYFLPIILAAFWFGLRGGLTASLTVTILYSPLVILSRSGHAVLFAANLLEVVLFNIVGGLLGWLRQREEQRRRELRLTGNLAAMGRAISAIAHDMKTPLAAIGGFSQQIKRKLHPEDPARRKLDLILQQTERLDALVKDMLSYARPLNLDTARADLNQLVRETLEVSKPTARKHEIIVCEETPAGKLTASFDRNRLQQALTNLVINAIEASPAGGQVTVRTDRRDNWAAVDVIDQGDGIPADKLEEIFKPFVTTKNGGTGLGLPIVKRIVDAHGGSLQLLQNRRGNTIFRISLPLARP